MNIQNLVNAVILDLEKQDDVEAAIHIDRAPKTLYATFSDAIGFLEYDVPDTDLLIKEVELEAKESNISTVDAFWCVLNSAYQK